MIAMASERRLKYPQIRLRRLELEIGIIAWLLFGIAAMMVARHKGRSGCTWFIVGGLLGPFALIVALLPSVDEIDVRQAAKRGISENYRKCPFCAEVIKKEANVCRFCGNVVTPLD
jgi:hypothetical protein